MFLVCFLVVVICLVACDHLRPCNSFLTYSFFSCKDRALERDRPYQRKKKTLLGLSYAKDGKKFQPFNKKFKMLGLEIDLGNSEQFDMTIGHTEERKLELVANFNDILAEGWLDPKEAERLRGRMVFFEG